MAKVISVKPKMVSLSELRTRAILATADTAEVPQLQTDLQGELKGILVPLKVRVRTLEGVFDTNYFFASRAPVWELTLEDGYTVKGTATHKLLVDRYTDLWATIAELRVGDSVVSVNGMLRVIDKQPLGNMAVGDICVPGPHSYLLENGTVSHNSLLANAMSGRMAERGFKVVVVPLEMSKVEMTSRTIARVAKLDVTKVLQKRLAAGEKELAETKYRRWSLKVKKAGGRLTVWKPKEDVTIEDTFAAVASLDADVVIVDYISLLAGTDGDDAWQQLGAIARLAKINAESTNRVNVLLCQVTEDGKIRYARAISEHSTNSWIWNTSKEERDKPVGRIKIEQPKCRNSKAYSFEVGFAWAHMDVVPVSEVSGDVGDVAEPMKNLTTDL